MVEGFGMVATKEMERPPDIFLTAKQIEVERMINPDSENQPCILIWSTREADPGQVVSGIVA
jgi:hypothetical protein